MKLPLSFLVLASVGIIAPAAVAGQQSVAMERGQKARPDPVTALDYTQTLIEGEELMFIMDVPSIPAQETPIVLAQAATLGASANLQPDFILNTCTETESTGDPMSAIRGVDPVGWLRAYIGNRDNRIIDSATTAAIKTTLLESTTHGVLNQRTAKSGAVYYMYDPTPNYVGNDRAVFLAEFEGRVYKIVVELHVFKTVNENNPTCSEPQLIKVTKPAKPSSGTTGTGAGYDLASVSVTFADLPDGALGQTNASGITFAEPRGQVC